MPYSGGYVTGAPTVQNRETAMAMADAYFSATHPGGSVQYFANQGSGHWSFIRADWLWHRGEWLTYYNYPTTSYAYYPGGPAYAPPAHGGGSGGGATPPSGGYTGTTPPQPAPPPPPPAVPISVPPVDIPPPSAPGYEAAPSLGTSADRPVVAVSPRPSYGTDEPEYPSLAAGTRISAHPSLSGLAGAYLVAQPPEEMPVEEPPTYYGPPAITQPPYGVPTQPTEDHGTYAPGVTFIDPISGRPRGAGETSAPPLSEPDAMWGELAPPIVLGNVVPEMPMYISQVPIGQTLLVEAAAQASEPNYPKCVTLVEVPDCLLVPCKLQDGAPNYYLALCAIRIWAGASDDILPVTITCIDSSTGNQSNQIGFGLFGVNPYNDSIDCRNRTHDIALKPIRGGDCSIRISIGGVSKVFKVKVVEIDVERSRLITDINTSRKFIPALVDADSRLVDRERATWLAWDETIRDANAAQFRGEIYTVDDVCCDSLWTCITQEMSEFSVNAHWQSGARRAKTGAKIQYPERIHLSRTLKGVHDSRTGNELCISYEGEKSPPQPPVSCGGTAVRGSDNPHPMQVPLKFVKNFGPETDGEPAGEVQYLLTSVSISLTLKTNLVAFVKAASCAKEMHVVACSAYWGYKLTNTIYWTQSSIEDVLVPNFGSPSDSSFWKGRTVKCTEARIQNTSLVSLPLVANESVRDVTEGFHKLVDPKLPVRNEDPVERGKGEGGATYEGQ